MDDTYDFRANGYEAPGDWARLWDLLPDTVTAGEIQALWQAPLKAEIRRGEIFGEDALESEDAEVEKLFDDLDRARDETMRDWIGQRARLHDRLSDLGDQVEDLQERMCDLEDIGAEEICNLYGQLKRRVARLEADRAAAARGAGGSVMI